MTLVTISLLRLVDIGDICWKLVPVAYVNDIRFWSTKCPKPSSSSHRCHQYNSSPTCVTTIDFIPRTDDKILLNLNTCYEYPSVLKTMRQLFWKTFFSDRNFLEILFRTEHATSATRISFQRISEESRFEPWHTFLTCATLDLHQKWNVTEVIKITDEGLDFKLLHERTRT